MKINTTGIVYRSCRSERKLHRRTMLNS